MSDGQIIRCRCGRLYRVYNMYCGDQSTCSQCRAKLEEELSRQNEWIFNRPTVEWSGVL